MKTARVRHADESEINITPMMDVGNPTGASYFISVIDRLLASRR